jgi:hypothetical protein
MSLVEGPDGQLQMELIAARDADGQRPAKPVKVTIESEDLVYTLELEPCEVVITFAGDNVRHLKPARASINGQICKNIAILKKEKDEPAC